MRALRQDCSVSGGDATRYGDGGPTPSRFWSKVSHRSFCRVFEGEIMSNMRQCGLKDCIRMGRICRLSSFPSVLQELCRLLLDEPMIQVM